MSVMEKPRTCLPAVFRQIMMVLRAAFLAVLRAVPALAQNVTLIDPITRFSNMNLSLPSEAYPVLQTFFTTPPDCGEGSYVGTGRLRGLRALITGGDSGIGRAVVIAYLREGASVAINYLPEEEPDAQDLADFVEAEGLALERIPGDLTNETFCSFLVEEAARSMGGLDILVGNAAWSAAQIGPNYRPLRNMTTAQLSRTFTTNVFANFWLTRAAIGVLPRGGSIIFTTSGMSENPNQALPDYGASKAAVSHMTSSFARHLASEGIRVNAVQPVLTYTPFLPTQGLRTEHLAAGAELSFYGRLAQPAELAGLYVSLAEPGGTYTSGNVYTASGGITF